MRHSITEHEYASGSVGKRKETRAPWEQVCKQTGTTQGFVNTCWQQHTLREKMIFANQEEKVILLFFFLLLCYVVYYLGPM